MNATHFNSLLQKLRSGDISALEAIYAEYHEKIYATGLAILKNHEDAQDLKTNVLLRLYHRKETEEIKNPLAFMYAITRNECYKMLKKKNRCVCMDVQELEIADNLQDPHLSLALKEMLSVLNEKEREVVVLHVLWGLKLQEIATGWNVPYIRIKWIYKSAKEKIKQYSRG